MRISDSITRQNEFGRQDDGPACCLRRGAEKLEIGLSEVEETTLLRHIELMLHWNRRVNLTAITDPDEMVVEHILDSLAISPWISGDRVLDIGSGGGFPGIPLAVALPSVSFTLLDSRGKRVEFLRHVVAALGLGNVSVQKERVENLRSEDRYDTLVCRAFAPLAQLLSLTRPLQRSGTHLLAMKGKAVWDEIRSLPEQWRQTIRTIPVQVPFLDAERYVVSIRFAEDGPHDLHEASPVS